MRKATAISAGLHAAVLLWATLSFSGKMFDVRRRNSLPVDLVSEKDFSEMTKGVKDAPKVETPKPLVEKKAEEPPKPVEDSKAKITEKKEVQATKEMAPHPSRSHPSPIRLPTRSNNRMNRSSRPRSSSRCRRRNLRRSSSRNSMPTRSRLCWISATRAECRDWIGPQQHAFPRNTLRHGGKAVAVRNRCASCAFDGPVESPVGVQDPNELIVNVTVRLRPDGRLAAPPFARVNGRSVAAMASRDSAVRAVLTGQPFDMLKPEHYESWKEIELTFDPKDMFRSN